MGEVHGTNGWTYCVYTCSTCILYVMYITLAAWGLLPCSGHLHCVCLNKTNPYSL